MRICVSCARAFHPSSGHLRCPACRSKNKCKCGGGKQLKSKRCKRCSTQSRSWNGNWKGGRTYHTNGYVIVRTRSHPRARRSGYVFEHILVMETSLGRHLYPDETVHHKNGVKDDNRPENLELWVRPQPSGIRVEDALQWAQEIVRRYGHLQQGSQL